MLVDRGVTEYDLALYLWDDRGGVSGVMEYSTELFPAPVIEDVVRRLPLLLDRALAGADQPLRALPLLLPEEERRLAAEAAATRRALPALLRAADLVAQRAVERPDAEAVSCGEIRLSYREVQRMSDHAAARLRAAGVPTGSLVGVSVERCAQMVPALLGVWKAGCAYLPLDPSFPRQRLADIVADSGVTCIVVDGRGEAPFGDPGRLQLLALDELVADGAPSASPAEARETPTCCSRRGPRAGPRGCPSRTGRC